jgi:arsenate reductase
LELDRFHSAPNPDHLPLTRIAAAAERDAGAIAASRALGYVRGMEQVTIYHNPVCGKSRGALDILHQRGIAPQVIEYLKSPPDRATLNRILDLLGGKSAELVRKDKRFKELGLNEPDYQTREQVVAVLLQHPELMERPVVIRGGRAVIARPSERVSDILP